MFGSVNSYFSYNRNAKIIFEEKLKIINTHTSVDEVFRGAVINRTLPSLHAGSLDITRTVPLISL